jgi:hypothetical protein
MFASKAITYEADSNGCWNCTSHAADTCGYPMICRNGKKGHMSRFIWIEKNGPIPESMAVRHKCDNPRCINPDHLEIGTHTNNMRDMIERGRRRSTIGSNNPRSKLAEDNVTDVMRRYKNGEKQTDIAKRYNVSKHCIFGIVHNRNWKFLSGGYGL